MLSVRKIRQGRWHRLWQLSGILPLNINRTCVEDNMKPEKLVEKLLESEPDPALVELVKGWVEGKVDAKVIIRTLRQKEILTREDDRKYEADKAEHSHYTGVYVEPGSREHGLIHVFLDNDSSHEIITVDADGTTTRVPNTID